MSATSINEGKLEAFMGQVVSDMGANISAPLMVIGEKLGLYRAMAHAGPLTAAEVAERSGTAERYVREWLGNQAAGGYVTYDPDTDRYTLPDEHALALADEDSPFYVLGVYDLIASLYADEEKLLNAFKSGEGMGWHEHDHRLFRGTERFFRPGYRGHLVDAWIPALEGVQEKLERGARVADVGCGHGASTVIMAEAFPNSEFFAFDYHGPSIERAREAAREAGVEDRISFGVAAAKDFPGTDYDLVCVFDCLHDMGDPVGAARHVRETLADDGTWMIVEPFAGDSVQDNLNPVGRIFYGASTVICTPASLDQEVGLALGAQAGQARLTEVLEEGGFTHVRRATETPFNLILEARA
jgi:SAM-dependent methyltransferase